MELPRYDGHLSIWANQGGVPWREEDEGGIRPKYKEQIVELVRAGRSPGSLAREFEPSEQTIRNWVKQADLDEGRRSDGLTTEARLELLRLKREVKRLRMERDILKKSRGLVREGERLDPQRGYAFMKAYRATFPLAAMCRVLGSLHQRVLRLAEASSLGADAARRRAPGQDPVDLGRQPGDLWLPSDPSGTASGGRAGEPEARGAPDEGFGHSGRDAEALQDGDDEEGREGPACAGPGEPQLLGRRARPAVGRRHHAGEHLEWLAVPRGRARCLEPPQTRSRSFGKSFFLRSVSLRVMRFTSYME